MMNKRFEKIYKDPKFKPIPKKISKIELNDERFKSMFDGKHFVSEADIDEYGRKVVKSKKSEMKRYYLEDKERDRQAVEEEDGEEQEQEDNAEGEEVSDTSEEFVEFLRGMNEEDGEEEHEGEDILQEEDQIPTGEETRRLAVVNIDWDNIHALDLFILFNSFVVGKGKVSKVEIYPSEFGIKEQQKEAEEGPDKKIYKDFASDERPRNEEEGYNQVELRKYELKKLKYYYAVVTCDSINTASELYNQCDGMEIERTQSFIDMRFIPDSLTSFPYPAKEVCDHRPHDIDYNPSFKANSALQKTKVELSWDQTNSKRDELLARAFHKEQFNQTDMQELLMSSESEDEEIQNQLDLIEDNKAPELNLLRRKRKEPKFQDGETIEIKFTKGFEGINKEVINESNKDSKSNWDRFKERKKNFRREKKMEEKRKKEEVNASRKGKPYKATKQQKSELGLLVDKSIVNKPFKYNPDDSRFKTANDISYAVDPTSKEYKKLKKRPLPQ